MDDRVREIQGLLPRAMLPDWVRLGSRLVRLLRDRRHAQAHDRVLERLLEQARDSVTLREYRRTNVPRVSYPAVLPISPRAAEIVTAIRQHQVIVIAGETGSGKTTQIPKMCLEAGLGIEARIGCTQPRRLAALSVSRRIAEELGVDWGKAVGCKIRFDDRSSPETYIKLMTDGILLAETQGDPLLSEYNAIIIDEAHERSLNIDFLLGYLKGLLARRPELKLLITSATIDTKAFSEAFGNAPVFEVSGRVFPVETIYSPLDAGSEETGDLTYIDSSVRTAEQIAMEPGSGDVLIFMPGERDIRETRDLLEARVGDAVEIVPLFGRLSAGDQQRVFAPAARRKVIIATNIAETSLTIPGIRFVIDSGLARISRYNPRTRTRRLPIEPIARSSAEQRKGRSGRVQDGVCIRLYSEEDFASRPAFTQPEIQRANLAEVILRMKAFRLGEIETFPFINPPSPAAIDSGYKLLQELGALDAGRELTELGRDLARLPIDPTLGRMLLQAQHEHATRELLIIASGLSIQDPRERPLDQKDAATAAHKRFADPRSDFLTLLNLWNAVHDEWERLRTQNQRRKFCKAHFLSYLRMREWQDLHAQLHDALEDLGTVRINDSNAAYEAIHRSILAGLLGHVATRAERNLYRGPGNRQLNVFPGSVLFQRGTPPKRSRSHAAKAKRGDEPADVSQPEWIVAGEVVETSQLFARTLAGIEGSWILELAAHLCKTTVDKPYWDPAAGQVLAEEKTFLYGLLIRERKVAFGNIDARQATEIFIRNGLVEEQLTPEPQRARRERDESTLSPSQLLAEARVDEQQQPAPYAFIAHNRRVRHKIETWQTRMRRHDMADLDEALFRFYAARLEGVSSFHELNRWLRDPKNRSALEATETDLIGDLDLHYDAEAFPDQVRLAGQPVPLSYQYTPGEEQDGVTLRLHSSLVTAVSPASVEWAVPGLREATISELLRALPKALRRELMPFGPKVTEIAQELQPGPHSLKQDLARFVRERYGVDIPLSAWPAEGLSNHLRPRIEVVGHDQKVVAAGRDLTQLRQQLEQARLEPAKASPGWERLVQRWEKFGLTTWNFGTLPDRVTEGAGPDLVEAWVGLKVEDGQVNVRLFRSSAEAQKATLAGIRAMVELGLQKDLAWLQKDLRALAGLGPRLACLCSVEELQTAAFFNLKSHLLPQRSFSPLSEQNFQNALSSARQRLPGLAQLLIDRVEEILKLRSDILRRLPPVPAAPGPKTLSSLSQLGTSPSKPAAGSQLQKEFSGLLPGNFLEQVPFERLTDLIRYLKAFRLRAERASVDPSKDQTRSRLVAPYVEALKCMASKPKSEPAQSALEELRWMVEEYKVSVFAQEIGTAMPISAKRLDEQLAKVRAAMS
jgi:ATP-dependent helicase HrpA